MGCETRSVGYPYGAPAAPRRAGAGCRTLLLAGVPLLFISSAGAASAQAQPGDSPAPQPPAASTTAPSAQTTSNAGAQPPALQEVVVTAQRRTERLQDVPISVQVVSGATLQSRNLNSLENLTQITPEVTVVKGGASNSLFIRGVGSGGTGGVQSFDQSVATFVDDIYHGRSRDSSSTFLDLDRVEILKGPQSTFFGNNAIAGALNIVTAKPGNTFDGYVRALGGQYGQYALEGAAGGPINDVLRVRAAITLNGTDGYIKNVGGDPRTPQQRNLAGRLTFVYRPISDLDSSVKIEAGQNHQRGDLNLQIANCPPSAPFKTGPFCKAAVAQGLPTQNIDGDVEGETPGQGVDLSTLEAVWTTNYHHWGHTFTSVTGYSGYTYNQNLDLDGTPTNFAGTQAPESYQQYSQELRVASPTHQLIEYLAGFYFQDDHLRYNQNSTQAFRNGTVTSTPAYAALAADLPLAQAITYAQNEDIYSVFGSATLNLTSKFKLSGGLRASSVTKRFDRDLFYATGTTTFGGIVPLPAAVANLPAGIFGVPAGPADGGRTDQALLPSGRAQYQLMHDLMAYVSYDRGFKAGGFNGSDASGSNANIPFKPEYVDAYEVGFKSEWLQHRLQVNFDLFRSDYNDLQVTVREGYATGPGFAVVRNAASSRSEGAELESQWVISRNFRISANAAYLDSFYVSFPNASPNSLQQAEGIKVQDLSGALTPYSAHWSGGLTGSYTTDLPYGYHLTTDLQPFLTSSYIILPGDTPRQPGYVRLDARVSVETPDRRLAFDVIGHNLTDRSILNFATAYPTSVGSFLESKEEGLNVAAQVRYKW